LDDVVGSMCGSVSLPPPAMLLPESAEGTPRAEKHRAHDATAIVVLEGVVKEKHGWQSEEGAGAALIRAPTRRSAAFIVDRRVALRGGVGSATKAAPEGACVGCGALARTENHAAHPPV